MYHCPLGLLGFFSIPHAWFGWKTYFWYFKVLVPVYFFTLHFVQYFSTFPLLQVHFCILERQAVKCDRHLTFSRFTTCAYALGNWFDAEACLMTLVNCALGLDSLHFFTAFWKEYRFECNIVKGSIM